MIEDVSSVDGSGDGSAFDTATAVKELRHLTTMLESDDGDAVDYLIEIKSQMLGPLTETEIDELAELVSEFDFEAALTSASKILSRLSK